MNLETIHRIAEISRKTNETDVRVVMNLDGTGKSKIETGIPFLNHQLELFAKHGAYDLEVSCVGDLEIDSHHSVEDIAITLGQAVLQAVGDKKGIARYGFAYVPMDEVLARAVIDLSGRFYLAYHSPKLSRPHIGNYATEMTEHFWYSFAEQLKCNLHIDILRGENTHHVIEGIFKATARALRQAVAQDSRIDGILSTKGSL
jgi:imidazoleglycerol-phosphate dehydratase